LDDGILKVPNAAGDKVNICIGYSMRSIEEVRAHVVPVWLERRETHH